MLAPLSHQQQYSFFAWRTVSAARIIDLEVARRQCRETIAAAMALAAHGVLLALPAIA
jgi:hypothetical protein